MNILHVSTIREWRGGDKQMLTTYHILKEFQDITQVILCPNNSVLSEKCKTSNIPFYTAPRNSKFSIGFLKKIIETVKKEKIDILHVHDSNALSLSLLALNFTPKVKLVYSRKRNNKVSVNFFKKLKYNSSKISCIVCVSEAVKDVLLPVVKDPEKIRVIYDGINIEKYSGKESLQILRTEYNLEKDSVLIGNIAGLTKQKDLFTFLETARKILDSVQQQVYFFIIGEGPKEEELKEYAGSLNLSKNVIFTGFRKDIPSILPELDVFLISSETEGLPLSVLEAFACKVPVVATAAGGTGEAVVHQKTGMLSPIKAPEALASGVKELLKNKELKNIITENAFQLVNNKFSLKVMQNEYYHFYKELENK